MLSGGPSSVYAEGAPGVDQALLAEFGRTSLKVTAADSTLFHGLPERQSVWMSHGDAVTYAPEGSRAITTTDGAPVAAFEDLGRRLAGVQFHPEVMYSQHGQAVLEHFLYEFAVASRPGR